MSRPSALPRRTDDSEGALRVKSAKLSDGPAMYAATMKAADAMPRTWRAPEGTSAVVTAERSIVQPAR